MSNIKETSNSPIEQKDSVYRVIHPANFRYYDEWLRRLKGYIGHQRLLTRDRRFPDGSAGFRVKYGDGTIDTLSDGENNVIIIPFWLIEMAGYRYREVAMMVLETFRAVTREINQHSISSRTIGFCPYVGGRSDHPSITPEGRVITGETIYAELIADLLAKAGCKELVTLDIHSYEAAEHFKSAGISLLNLTALPLLAHHVTNGRAGRSTHFNPDNSGVISLDYGSLQRNIYLANLLDLQPVKDHLVICGKKRDHLGKTKMDVVYPNNPQSVLFEKQIYTADDVGDTFGSVEELAEIVTGYKVKELTMLLTHGTFSFPAAEKIEAIRKFACFKSVCVTDSLPIAKYDFEGEQGIETISPSTASLFARALPAILEFGTKAICDNPQILRKTKHEDLLPYILTPQNKDEVVADFMSGRY